MNVLRFLFADLIAALVSSTLMMGIGYFASENYERFSKDIKSFQLLILVLVLIFGLRWYRKRKELKKETNRQKQDS